LQVERVRFVYPSENKKASLIMIEARRDSKSETVFEQPLYNFIGEEFSYEVKEIFSKAKTYTLKADISGVE
jgi:tRNA1Val (adenine37-N6)-methyltransferase